ncbi:DUF2975 domain-containing protein [Nesterenkonia sp.]|uniref:DUF2975 domain-containing protein n=1 Tax=Nesterenkonia sp. TaxID=704201 RepID=UPI0026152466|nr:DUF2975 domain-containing protein [Nesterenkonia sp.]
MTSHRWVVAALRIFLILLFALLLFFQFFSLPGEFAHRAELNPTSAHLQIPATAITIFWVLCVQAVIVCVWKLLTLVAYDRIFSEDSLVWVNIILGTLAAGWVSLFGVFVFIGFRATDPALPLILGLLLAIVTVIGLLMIVMRALLRQATTLRADMDQVI